MVRLNIKHAFLNDIAYFLQLVIQIFENILNKKNDDGICIGE